MPPASRRKVLTTNAEPLFLAREALPAITALSDNTIDALIKSGEFPKPRQTSDRRVAWLLREVREWAETRPISNLPPVPNSSEGGRQSRRKKSLPNDQQAA